MTEDTTQSTDAPPAPRAAIAHDGFHLEVTAKEIRENFNARLAHHEHALHALEASNIILTSKDGQVGKSDMVKLHKHQIRLIKFIVSHVPEQDTFLLTMNEVDQLMLLRHVTDMGNEEES